MIKSEQRGNQLVILHIMMDSIDALSAKEIENEYESMQEITVLDFAKVMFINSAGISALLKFVVKARKEGHKVYALHVTSHHRKIFEMVEMTKFMPLLKEEDLTSMLPAQ